MPAEAIKKKHIPKTLAEAMKLHEAGDLPTAEALYNSILAADPKDANALLNLSTLHSQRGEFDKAEMLIKRLTVAQPKMAYAHFALGNVLGKANRHEEAGACYARAAALEPTNPAYYFNRAVALDALKRYEEALENYDRAIALQPNHYEAQVNNANNLFRLGRHEEALVLCNKIIAANPTLALAYTTRGNAYGALKKTDEALADYNKAIELQPDLAVAHNNRGNIFEKDNQTEALASYDAAIAQNPQYANAHNNRGTALNKVGRFEEALESCNTALAIDPTSALAYDTRGNALAGLWRFDEALADYDRAMQLQPDITTTPWNKALLCLLLGDLEQGFRLYEGRWKTEFQRGNVRHFTQPLWLNDVPLEGRTIFVYPEQGYGDFIQMSRYLPLLLERGAKEVIAETHHALIPLFASSFAGRPIRFVPPDTVPEQFDLQCPIMTLPHAFNTVLETIPANIPYLSVTLQKQTKWNSLLGAKKHPRVGLVWSGATAHLNDANRSIPLEALETMLRTPGIEFHSLQKDVRERDLPNYGLLTDHRRDIEDFADTAALVNAMDLVISVDTSVAHLAGALGKPLWMMLPYVPDYRWLLARTDSPWYPTARLFRQPERNDWPNLISQIIEALHELTARHS